MERFKRHILLILMVMGLTLLAGCNLFQFDFFDESEEDNSSVITLTPNEDEKENPSSSKEDNPEGNNPIESEKLTESTPTPSDIQPTKNIELPLYTVNVDTGEIEAEIALVPADTNITPDLIVDKVVESMADRSIEVGIEEVSYEGDAVIVSFYKDKAPLSEMGSVYEAAILDAIAQSLIDNLKDYKKVIYRAEGKAYISGHFEFELNDIYLEDK
jgi:cytoskeletal protein RodZ